MSAITRDEPIILFPGSGGETRSEVATLKAILKDRTAVLPIRFIFEPGNCTRFEFYAAYVQRDGMRQLLLAEVSWMRRSYTFHSKPSRAYLAEKFDRIKDSDSDLDCVAELIGGLL